VRTIDGIRQVQNVRQLELERQLQLKNTNQASQVSFSDMLAQKQQATSGVQFSKHAAQRVEQRHINMTDELLSSLNKAVVMAREKGARDLAVIGQEGTFIVNVPNNIVITTISGNESKNTIYTNIDSAVVI